MRTAGNFQALFDNIGMGDPDLGVNIADLAQQVAWFTGTDESEASEAVFSAILGEGEPATRLGLNIDAATPVDRTKQVIGQIVALVQWRIYRPNPAA